MPELLDSGDAWEKAAFMRGQKEPPTWAEFADGLPEVREYRAKVRDEFERLLREKYKPILTPDEYAQLRQRCGLGELIDGDVVSDDRRVR